VPATPVSQMSEERLQLLARAILGAADTARIGLTVVYIDRAEPEYAYMSPVNAELLGYPLEELMRMPVMATVAQDELPKLAERWQCRASSEPSRFETAAVTKDGRRVEIEVAVCPGALDARPVSVCFFADITDRRRALEELGRSEKRFRQLVEGAPEAVWIFDGSGLRFVNPAAVRMLGYPDAASVLAIDPRQLVGTDDTALVERTQRIMSGTRLEPREYRTRRADGSFITVEVSSIPIEFEGSSALLCFGRDVTERKRMEAQLIHADRLAALGTLSAGVAHEINNPLAYALLGIDHALAKLRELPEVLDGAAALEEQLREARHGVERVVEIVRKLRAFADLGPEQRAPIDVRDAVREAAEIADNEVRHHARLVTELGEVPLVMASATQLEQVFVNLLVNAAQACAAGPGRDHAIRVTTRADASGDVAIEVSDTGPGVLPEARARVFDPFFTTKSIGAGIGLGLSICHSIIAAHGGRIELDSERGNGTTFRIWLPAWVEDTTADRPSAEPVSSGPIARPRRLLKVLVVDDEPRLAASLGVLLAGDAETRAVHNARDAVAEIERTQDYDAVLCDLMMPGMTGMELYAEIARKYPGLERRFVFMTGGAFTASASAFIADLKNPLLEKPFGTDALREALEVVAQPDSGQKAG
jgi:two-component system, cell cycle sensor histidine kinase and response regulator CckA